MGKNTDVMKNKPSPIIRPASISIAFFVLLASLSGLFDARPYARETLNWATQARGQDVGNLFVVPVLLLSAFFYTRSVKWQLIFQGTLMYLVYAYAVYSFAVHFNNLFLVYVAVFSLSLHTLVFSVSTLYRNFVASFPGKGRIAAGVVLVGTGVLFGLMWLGEVIPATLYGITPQSLQGTGLWVNPIHVIDLSVVLPGMIASGVSVLRGNKFGLYSAAPWLTFSVFMGTSIVATMAMFLAQGDSSAVVPLAMVGLVVLMSLISLFAFIKGKLRG